MGQIKIRICARDEDEGLGIGSESPGRMTVGALKGLSIQNQSMSILGFTAPTDWGGNPHGGMGHNLSRMMKATYRNGICSGERRFRDWSIEYMR